MDIPVAEIVHCCPPKLISFSVPQVRDALGLTVDERHSLIQLNCYPHSTRRNRKVMHGVLGEQLYGSLMTSWKILHDCTSFDVYSDCLIPLFVKRHRRGSTEIKDAIGTLISEYLVPFHGRMNHSRAAAPPGYSNDDQGLEGQFRYIKDSCFNFQRHSTEKCVDLAFDFLRGHSQQQAKTRPFVFEISLNGSVVGPCYFQAQKLAREHKLKDVVIKRSNRAQWFFPASALVLDR